MRETGFVEGRDVKIEYRWAEGQFNRLPSFAAELVRRNVAAYCDFRRNGRDSGREGGKHHDSNCLFSG